MQKSISAGFSIILGMVRRRRLLIALPILILTPASILIAKFLPGGYMTHSLVMLQESVASDPFAAIGNFEPSRERLADSARSIKGLLLSDLVLGPVVSAKAGPNLTPVERANAILNLQRRLRVEFVGNGLMRFELDGAAPLGLGKELNDIVANMFDVLINPPRSNARSLVVKGLESRMASAQEAIQAIEHEMSAVLPKGLPQAEAQLARLEFKRSAADAKGGDPMTPDEKEQARVLAEQIAKFKALQRQHAEIDARKAAAADRLATVKEGGSSWQPIQPLLKAPHNNIIIDPARDPEMRAQSRRAHILSGILGGVLLGLFLAALAELMDPTLRSAERLTKIAGVPYLGTLAALAAVGPDELAGDGTGPGSRNGAGASSPSANVSPLRRVSKSVGLFFGAVLLAVVCHSPVVVAEHLDRAVVLPAAEVKVAVPPVSGRSIHVAAGGNLQVAIDQARGGDEIVLDAGAVFKGSFKLRNHPSNGWITIRSGGPLPKDGTRAGPAEAHVMATLVAPGFNMPALSADPGAHGYYIAGLHITVDNGIMQLTSLINLGDGGPEQGSLESQPRDIVIDRSYIHGTPTLQMRRAIALHSANTAIINSTIVDVHHKTEDSQAICGWNGSGPYLIQNNLIEASGENILFGGADPSIAELIPSDITIRDNDITKPDDWRGKWLVKNLFELKIGHRVLVEKNRMSNNWVDGQSGVAVVLKSTHQSGRAPWSKTSHVTLRDNHISNSPSAISIATAPEAHPAQPASHFAIYRNTFTNIGQGKDILGRVFMLLGYGGVLEHVSIIQNTAVTGMANLNAAVVFDGQPVRRLKLVENVLAHGEYGIKGSDAGVGATTIAKFAPDAVIEGNTLVGGKAAMYGKYAAKNKFAESASR